MSFASGPSASGERGAEVVETTGASGFAVFPEAEQAALQDTFENDELISGMFAGVTDRSFDTNIAAIWQQPAAIERFQAYAALEGRDAKLAYVQTNPEFVEDVKNTHAAMQERQMLLRQQNAEQIVNEFWPDFAVDQEIDVPDEYNQQVADFLLELVVQGYDLKSLNLEEKTSLASLITNKVESWKADTDENESIERVYEHLDVSALTLSEISKILLENGDNESLDPVVKNRMVSYKQKLESIQTMGSAQEQPALQQIVSTAKVDVNASDPRIAFADVFTQVDAAVEAGTISQETADEVYVSILGQKKTPEPLTVPNSPQEFSNLLTERSTQTVRDPKTGEVVEQRITKPIEFRNGESHFTITPLATPGQYKIHIPLRSQLPREFTVDEAWLGEGLTKFNPYLALQAMSYAGFTDIFGSEYTEDRTIEKNYALFSQATDLKAGDGEMWTTQDTGRVVWILQMLHPRGDWGQQDVNKENWKEYAADKGVYDLKTDAWDYEALRLWRDAGIFAVGGKDGEALDRSGLNPIQPEAPAEGDDEAH